MQQRFLYPGQNPAPAAETTGDDGLGPLGDGWGECGEEGGSVR